MNRCTGRGSTVALGGCLLLELLLVGGLVAREAAPGTVPSRPGELFRPTNLWTVGLTFTAEQWAAMEPKGGPEGFFGGPGGRGGPGAPRPGAFGPGMFLGPAFMKQADGDHDGKLSRQEFDSLAEKWFGEWDKENRGNLGSDALRAGLNSALGPPDFGPLGGGRPGGAPPGGPRLAMNLQGAEGKRNGVASMMGVEFEYVHADLQFEGVTFKDVAVRYKGNGTFLESRGSIKRSLKIELNKYVKGQKLAGMSKLNLHNNVTDASWMNEVLAYRLYRDASVPAPRTAYARVFVTVPGKHEKNYFGLYSLVEEVDRHFLEENFGSKEGAIFKPVTSSLFTYLGDDWAKYKQTYDPKELPTDQDKRRLIELCRLVTQANDEDFAARLGDYIELEEFARFMAVMVWLSDMDGILGPGQNLYLYLPPKTHRFVFVPWDQDHSFGQFAMRGSQEEREQLSVRKPWQGKNRFLERVYKVEAFKKAYLGKLDEFSQTICKPDRFYAQVDELAAAIRAAVDEESQVKLSRFNKVVSGESVEGAGFGGFMGATKPIKAFVKVRAQSVNDQLAGKAEGQVLGEFAFGGRGPGGGRPRPAGPGGFGPGNFLGDAFMDGLDANKDGTLSRVEFLAGFRKWFEAWDTDKSGFLTDEQLVVGINHDLAPAFGRPPGGASFGPPGGP